MLVIETGEVSDHSQKTGHGGHMLALMVSYENAKSLQNADEQSLVSTSEVGILKLYRIIKIMSGNHRKNTTTNSSEELRGAIKLIDGRRKAEWQTV